MQIDVPGGKTLRPRFKKGVPNVVQCFEVGAGGALKLVRTRPLIAEGDSKDDGMTDASNWDDKSSDQVAGTDGQQTT